MHRQINTTETILTQENLKKGREQKGKIKSDIIKSNETRFKKTCGRSSMGLLSSEMYFLKKASDTPSHCVTHLVVFYKWGAKSSQL